jgi:hypothetical protein
MSYQLIEEALGNASGLFILNGDIYDTWTS